MDGAATKDRTTTSSPTLWEPFPEIDLRQLLRMTDDTGMFQHAVHAFPDPNHGYCIDDNDRALIAGLLHAQLRGYDERVVPVHRYLTFLTYAFNDKEGCFRNFMGYDRRWLEDEGSQDSQGRTLWALGLACSKAPNESVAEVAASYFQRALGGVEDFAWHRSRAFAVLGLSAFLQVHPEHGHAADLHRRFAEAIFDAYRSHATADWPWWEDEVTYDNAKLPHALMLAGRDLNRPDMVEAALHSLKWLLQVQTAEEGHLSIIGNEGWLRKDGHRAKFDQQPLEAHAMVHACLEAAKLTGDDSWADHAWRCFEWFRGGNDLGVSLYDPESGGCQDGLRPDGVNKNQGAESVLAYLLSVLELHLYRESKLGRVTVTPRKTIRYAILGLSDFAKFCADQYQSIDGVELAGVWTRTTEKASAYADKTGAKAHESLKDLLADPTIDLVHIAGVPSMHAEHALRAIEAGKHVLCEKPLATTVADARQLIDAASARDRVLAVNQMMRFGPAARAIQQLIASRTLGAPLRGTFVNRAGDSGLPPDHWFWDESLAGGIFVEHGVHFFDLVGSWLGAGTVINAMQLHRQNGGEQPGVIDQVACDVRYGTGAAVNFYHGFTQSPELDEQSFTLICERGTIQATGWITREVTIDAVLADSQVAEIEQLLPGARVTTVNQFEAGRETYRRHRTERVDRHVHIGWQATEDKQTLYGMALQGLMRDAMEAVSDRSHTLRVTADDALRALQQAVEATRIAKQTTP